MCYYDTILFLKSGLEVKACPSLSPGIMPRNDHSTLILNRIPLRMTECSFVKVALLLTERWEHVTRAYE